MAKHCRQQQQAAHLHLHIRYAFLLACRAHRVCSKGIGVSTADRSHNLLLTQGRSWDSSKTPSQTKYQSGGTCSTAFCPALSPLLVDVDWCRQTAAAVPACLFKQPEPDRGRTSACRAAHHCNLTSMAFCIKQHFFCDRTTLYLAQPSAKMQRWSVYLLPIILRYIAR